MNVQHNEDVTIAEAAAWIARLQGARTGATEAAFREWLRAAPAHRQAFNRATEVWDVIPGAARVQAAARERAIPFRSTARFRPALAACVALIVAGAAVVLWALRPEMHVTGMGEQQTFVLSDGTRVFLNTDSRLAVSYSDGQRHLRLERGEGLFEVARDPVRPFVVQAGSERFRALGTTFLVRSAPVAVSVTLIDGGVEIARGPQREKAVRLAPGERVTVRTDAGLSRDRPDLEALLAWRSGKVIFDDVSLLDAVAEINRYGGPPLAVADPALAELRVSGVFATRAPQEFAATMAQLHKLTVSRRGAGLALER